MTTELVRVSQAGAWERLLQHYGGKTDDTPVPSMKMGNHIQMSIKGKPQPADEQRAQRIVVAARTVVAHYSDVNTALRDGYRPFHPTGKMNEEVHYRHVDFSGGPRSLPLEEQSGPHAQFGLQGSIHTDEACKESHGVWIPVVFGWMTHVHPNANSPDSVWAGMDMHMDANTGDDEMKK